ncbi:MAG: nicotinate-nucleotide--dimethylbenzimidazole phosphoribosyltransferase [Dehalococcoidia bacterium]|nr:nicotinate-nucleotide--dimethylbenzimidazole phosphoribosyltransferase [Dehalococcoidia bacterium]
MITESPQQVIARTAAAIAPPNEDAAARAAERQERLTKPPGSLGRLESLATYIAGLTGSDRPRLARRLLVVAAGDHGVAAHDVSAYPQSVTAQMAANFAGGGAAVSVLADHAGARVRIVDAGVAGDTVDAPGLLRLRLGAGTDDITRGPAMSRELAARTIAEGIALFEAEHDAAGGGGVDIVGCGEMGIGNSTAAATIVAAVTGRPPRSVTGRGTGIDDDRFEAKIGAVERALEVNRPDATDGVALLAAIGGFEIGVLAGVYLAAAAARVPAVVDGLISGAAALVATAVEPAVQPYLVASHRSVEPGHSATLEQLALEPLFDLGMRLGEGTGAAIGITLCVAACRLLDEMATFDEAGVDGSDTVVMPE